MYTDFGVSIPAVRVRYISLIIPMVSNLKSFNSRSAGKIHYMPAAILSATACFNSRSVGKIHGIPRDVFNAVAVFQFPQCG